MDQELLRCNTGAVRHVPPAIRSESCGETEWRILSSALNGKTGGVLYQGHVGRRGRWGAEVGHGGQDRRGILFSLEELPLLQPFHCMELLEFCVLVQISQPMLPFYSPRDETRNQSQEKASKLKSADERQSRIQSDSSLIFL